MISITCTKCKAPLTIDDGFAGLACRCQHCGTIQTVPTKLKGNAPASAARPQPAAKALYENPRGSAGGNGSGSSSLADAVVSSGLGSGRLHHAPPPKATGRQLGLFIAIAALVILAAGVAGVWMLVMNRPPSKPSGPAGTGSASTPIVKPDGSTPAVPAVKGAQFCGIPLEGDLVIYVLDHGQSSRDFLDYLNAATVNSIRSLGPTKRFQVIFWSRDGSEEQIPKVPETATPQAIEAAAKDLENIVCGSVTELEPALNLALSRQPAAVVVVTGKNSWLSTNAVKVLDSAPKAKVHCIALDGGGTVLQAIAKRTGGQFKEMRPDDLKNHK